MELLSIISQHSCSTNADAVSSPVAARLDARDAGRVTRSPAAQRSCAMLVPACTPTARPRSSIARSRCCGGSAAPSSCPPSAATASCTCAVRGFGREK